MGQGDVLKRRFQSSSAKMTLWLCQIPNLSKFPGFNQFNLHFWGIQFYIFAGSFGPVQTTKGDLFWLGQVSAAGRHSCLFGDPRYPWMAARVASGWPWDSPKRYPCDSLCPLVTGSIEYEGMSACFRILTYTNCFWNIFLNHNIPRKTLANLGLWIGMK